MSRNRTWALALLGVVAGTVFGITLTLGTVLWPRQRQLSRQPYVSAFLATFDPETILEAVLPGQPRTIDASIVDRSGSEQQIWGRSFVIETKVPASEQQALLSSITAQLQAGLQSKGLYRLNTFPPATYVRPEGVLQHHWFSYGGTPQGSVHLWGVGDGDQLTLFLSIHER